MRRLLTDGWRFQLGDPTPPVGPSHLAGYMANKAGYARGPARPTFDDSDWRVVDVPHDWAIEGAPAREHHLSQGYLPRGVGWYRRAFALDPAERGKRLTLTFDGVATHCTVYVNGHLLHRNWCGYTPFTVYFTDVATFGPDAPNVVAVRVDATTMEGWWYEGAGLYRDVWLGVADPLHIDDVFVTSDLNADGSAMLTIRTTVANDADASAMFDVAHAVEGAAASDRHSLDARTTREFVTTLRIDRPTLWSIDSPHLYSLKTTLGDAARFTPFGIRTIRFTSDGFVLNGHHVLLKGTCNHQDHAGLGVAVPESIDRFRIAQLKSIGSNAYRSAHNPPSRGVLDACDALGLVVMDENRTFGSSPDHVAQLDAMILRDRNHPSVVLWSICNEESIQGTPVAANIARSMIARVKQLDPSRPVTGAVSGGLMDDVGLAANVFEVMSVNYNLPLHDAYHAKHPSVPLIVAETGCTYATRGTTTTAGHHFASDDATFAPWGQTARATWEHVVARPYLAGMFVWTGFDYRGEPTPHEWPSVQSHWGLFDLCGFEKDAARLHRSFFTGESFTPTPPGDPTIAVVAIGLEVHPTMSSDRIVADGRFALPITLFALDANGTRVPCASTPITIDVRGPARLIGVGNGDPTSHAPAKGDAIPLFNGLAQAIVQTTRNAGDVTIIARSPGLPAATLTLASVVDPNPIPRVPIVVPRHLVGGWRMSAIVATPPDPFVVVSDQDMNTWDRVDPAAGPQAAWSRAGGHALYRAKLAPPKSMHATGGTIVVGRVVADRVDVWIDQTLVATRDPIDGELRVPFDPSASPRQLTLRLTARAGAAGLSAAVELRRQDGQSESSKSG